MKDQPELRADFLFNQPQLIELLASWHHGEWGKIRGETLADSVALLEKSKSPNQLPIIIVAFRDGRPVGMARLIEHDIPDRSDLTPWLAAVYVPPTERNRGVGSFLVSSIAAEARRVGYKKIYLFTGDKIALYAKLGWQLSEIFSYRTSVVAIMVLNIDAALGSEEKKSSLTYVTYLHNYIYGLKKEAEERGKSILTAAALYTASLVWFIKFATDVTRDSALMKILTTIAVSSGGIGFLFVIWSLSYALRTFAPQVVDASSPMEPVEIVSKPLDQFEDECSTSLNDSIAARALAREIYAVSQLQIARSAFVQKASSRFAVALSLLILCVFSVIGLYLARWTLELGADWPPKIGQAVWHFIEHLGQLFSDLTTVI